MDIETLICIPGPWKDRSAFVRQVAGDTKGKFLFAGLILACPESQDHVELDFEEHNPSMSNSFSYAGRGKLLDSLITQIEGHESSVYIHFPYGILEQKEHLLKYTQLIRQLGGYAIKVESSGVAMTWDVWFEALKSDNDFDLYTAFVALTADDANFMSYGMHHFNLPDCQMSRDIDMEEVQHTMNVFNYYQIDEKPALEAGHTFSTSTNAPTYRTSLIPDNRTTPGDPFYNPNGLWVLKQEP